MYVVVEEERDARGYRKEDFVECDALDFSYSDISNFKEVRKYLTKGEFLCLLSFVTCVNQLKLVVNALTKSAGRNKKTVMEEMRKAWISRNSKKTTTAMDVLDGIEQVDEKTKYIGRKKNGSA
jgi:tRNA A58 N-methylase Trm61